MTLHLSLAALLGIAPTPHRLTESTVSAEKADTGRFGRLSIVQCRTLKGTIDVTVALLFLIFVAPLMVLVAVAIKLDSSGPMFYCQERVGQGGRAFLLWKFRSMVKDAERDGRPLWASVGDPRVTRVGRVIRYLRIDELPQLFNVLRGDMSLVGPRPERPYFVDQLSQIIPGYDRRHLVKPGITGWAQVNYPYGASIEDARQKLSYDLHYVNNSDLLLDWKILAMTVGVVLLGKGAR
jgi:exopolysaccharide biosynthesis polyprenyl glycosylphosphotransferase